jgi:predicted nucleic acid-binding Zn ribbon protein
LLDLDGPAGAAHARPESFDDGALVVRADSAAWATELRLLTPQLTAAIARVAGEGTVTSVIVRGPSGGRRRGGWSVRG